ncbi:MAG: hypothetical protein NZ602_14805 [Thermoguttaceae bacterium]|nr:hypothetical protein [Thermoguttaceae bacterium]MDW8039047.1 hypothetical protein [Thermoguttaceae bacterium]
MESGAFCSDRCQWKGRFDGPGHDLWFPNSSSLTTKNQPHLAVQEFLGLDLGRNRASEECRFRHLLKEHRLGNRILEIVNRHLERAGIRV